MISILPLSGLRPILFGVTTALALAAVPGVAHAGFFDQLFGGGTVEPAQPTYDYQAPQSMSPDFGKPIQPRIKKKIVREEAPVRQKTTDLMHDKTLHAGDAIMMKDGLHIYSGAGGDKHTARQFVPIDQSRGVSSKTRTALLAMDTTRNDPLRKGPINPDTLASGRSAVVSTPLSKGFKITDARGQSVRYVGP